MPSDRPVPMETFQFCFAGIVGSVSGRVVTWGGLTVDIDQIENAWLRQAIEDYRCGRRGAEMSHGRQSLLPTPNPRPGLRLLCVLVRKAGHPIAQPVAVSGLPAPWAALSGRWPLALPSPFLLRETRPVPASAEVLARCVRQRETHARRSTAQTFRPGVTAL